MQKLLTLLLSFSLLAGACKEDEEKKQIIPSAISTGRWKLIASSTTVTASGFEQTTDAYALLKACERDNLYEFKPDGSLILDEGASKCNDQDPQQVTGTWALTQNDTYLKINSPGVDNAEAEIIELTETRMEVKFTSNDGGVLATTTSVYQKL